MTQQTPLKLNHNERFTIARHVDPHGNPVELNVTVSFAKKRFPNFSVEHEIGKNETDLLFTTDAQEALRVYNAIIQGDAK